ncbi:ATP-dependent helicase [Bombilactobacillus bombi]|uniref:ATP-dependent helicase n=1 Tax=Bombilactobacillus bombi TaxID=1303590 RepID=A0A3R6ZUB1_9LACO|nr:DEAD/DEAH box helicase [Bombilactobacillus bombi]RHW44288.1 ATP-dependent helicase [Bombilactobacillus bombi]
MEIPAVYQTYFQQHLFQKLTPVQKAVYQPFIQRQSLLALAPTGSGKTLAFGMPLLEQVQLGQGIQKIILEPSQELAIQTRDVLRELNPQVNIYGVIGGANLKRQIEHLKQKPEVIVGTLGRILDLVDKKKLKLQNISTLLVDEADEMLSDRLEDIRGLINRMPSAVQLAFFSATTIPLFSELKKWFGQEFTAVNLSTDESFRAGLRHYFITVDNQRKSELLQRLAHRKNKKNLVFCQSSKQLHRLAADMRYRKTYFTVLDTSDPKKRRADALNAFRNRKTSMLLATDVAARGMDIPDLTTVINLENPQDLTEYIHRSGRTGRMGRNGEVITLGNQHDWRQLQTLLKNNNIPLTKVYLQGDELSLTPPHINKKQSAPKKKASTPKKRWRNQKNKGKQH